MKIRLSSLRTLKQIFVISFMSMGLAGCVPKDVPAGESSGSSKGYKGFSGITSAETVNGTRVAVTWTPSTDPKVVAYNIYDASFKFQPKLIKTVTAPADRATLSGLANQNLYAFRVRAANAENEEDDNTVDLKAIPYSGIDTVEVISSNEARVNFPDGSNADQIKVFCRLSTETEMELYATVINTSLTQTMLDDLVPGVEYVCRTAVEIDGFIDNNPKTVTFTPMGQASSLAFSTQPGNGSAGNPLSVQPVIRIRDANGNVVAGGPDSTATITLTVANASPTPGSVKGTFTVDAVAGVAVFPDIFLEEAGQKILTATKSDTSSLFFGTGEMTVNSNLFTVTPGAVSADTTTIAISPAPPDPPRVANGIEFYTVTFTLKDQFGNPVSGIRPTMASNIVGDTISQPTLNSNSLGVTTGSISSTIADFAPNLRRLSINTPSGLSSIGVEALFVPGPATRLAYALQPMNSPAGDMGMNNIQIEVQDAQGNRIRTGPSATAEVSISIASNVNGAILTGTNPKMAADGVVSFSDLGIDRTGNGYRLVASAGVLTPAFSNTFNVTAGIPKKIAISGPPNVTSGLCSTAITIQLQDLGNNPANAIQSTPVTLSGFGDGSFYTSNTCGGAPVGTSVTFTAGTNTRTLYYRGNSAEALIVSASDTSAVMTTGQYNLTVSPNKLSMIAQAASPAPPGTPLSVVAGQCSTEIVITPLGNNNNPGPTFIPTTVSITGLSGSDAQIFSDAACTQVLNPLAVVLPINSGPVYSTKIYLKDPKAESLMISVSDPGAILTTTTSPQSVIVMPSNLNFVGPTAVVAGQCSTAFTIQMRDTLGNPFAALTNTNLTINGIPISSVGRFYTSPSCAGGGSRDALTFPQGNTSLQVYFRSVSSDTLSISISDPAGKMATSQTINLSVSPSALRIVAPVQGNAKTNVCAGPFYIDTLDATANPTNAVANINVNLAGTGTAASFYSDSDCNVTINQVVFTAGQNRKTVYFKGYYPEASLTLEANDQGGVLTQGTQIWAITAAKGWMGTAATEVDGSNNDLWFRMNAKVVAARADGIYSASRLEMSPDHQYLYVVDTDRARVHKYDYVNQTYIGWLGQYTNTGLPIVGSRIPTPSTASCVATPNGGVTPGWCVGGVSQNMGNTATGGLYSPFDMADDGTYVYVVNYNGQTVTRYNATTGAFDGYLGMISDNTGMQTATGGPGTCTTVLAGNITPGWCKRGTANNTNFGNPMIADGRLRLPTAITFDNDYIYVANRQSVNRYNKSTGAFAGWIGMVAATPSSGAAGCNTRVDGQMTPGWCFGGQAREAAPATPPVGGMNNPNDIFLYDDGVNGERLYVLHANGTIVAYNKTSGAVVGLLPDIAMNWHTAGQWATDGTRFFFADQRRIIKTEPNGLLEGWMGKVSNNAGLSGSGCSGLAVNANTPGWCLGGSARPGMDERSFRNLVSIVYDGNGKIIVGQNDASGQVKRFDVATGAFEGTLSLESTSPKRWSNDATMVTARHGFDDDSLYNPQASHIDGEFLFLAEFNSSRIKKFNRRTGELLGWIGAITSSPTGGDPGCIGANSYTASPGWCLGANFQPSSQWGQLGMVNTTTNGIVRNPAGIASDGTYIYVTDRGLHRISRFRIDNGAPAGWIGRIGTSPTSGDPGCNGAAINSFTPGWCGGGMSTTGNGDGHLTNPYGIIYHGGNLYVIDGGNHRVVSYSAATGAFNGWIGRINAAPSGGCTTGNNGAYVVSTSGWCIGGTAQQAANSDRKGGFWFWTRSGITTDGVNLYIANFYNSRVDKISFNGEYVESIRTRQDIYTDVWSANPAVVSTWGATGCSRPNSLWTDGVHLYGVNYSPCNRLNSTFAIWKISLSTGQMVGWQGGIDPNNLPNDGDPDCAGATEATPGWCRNGRPASGQTMGTFSGDEGDLTGDANFIYVSDEVGNRITRFPK